MKNGKALVVFSGGMDSTVALYQTVKDYGASNVKAVSFNYNSKHNDMEYMRAWRTCQELGVESIRIDLASIAEHLDSHLLKGGGEIPEGHYAQDNMKKTVVPFRNGIMLSVACGVAESLKYGEVILGNHYGDHAIYPDCRKEFIDNMSEAMRHGTYENVTISSPFCGITKTQIATLGAILDVNWLETYSCYKGGEEHCGLCSTCYERREAFVDAGVLDPTPYMDKTPFTVLREKYEAEFNRKKDMAH